MDRKELEAVNDALCYLNCSNSWVAQRTLQELADRAEIAHAIEDEVNELRSARMKEFFGAAALNKFCPADEGTRSGAILREAAGLVDGPRGATHGDKEASFTAVSKMWNAYLDAKPEDENFGYITAADVVAMIALMKIGRSYHGKHIPDHGVDAAGYMAIWGELREKEVG